MFKENDKVKVKNPCSGTTPEIIYILKYHDGELATLDKKGNFLCNCQNNWILVNEINVRNLNSLLIKKSKIIEKIPIIASPLEEELPF